MIQYGKGITRCRFEDGRWQIDVADGSTNAGAFVIAATGVLHHACYPGLLVAVRVLLVAVREKETQ